MADNENPALAKLRAAAGVMDKPQVERLDWMYEQSATMTKNNEDELMNMPVAGQKDQDVEDVKKLGDSTAGSLFLRSATRTSEDMLRKLREDPLFQIKRQEQAARESMMANPLIRARLQKKAEKEAKKVKKKEKKAAKKAKKAAKKAKKAAKKAAKGSSSSSSSSSSSDDAKTGAAPAGMVASREEPTGASRDLGPSGHMVSKREEYAQMLAARKEAAIASRGAPRRMEESEKRRRLEEMEQNAKKHERFKDQRIAAAEQREKEQEDREAQMRMNSDQKYFRDMRQEAYMESGATMADRLKNQRHRRQKQINDPLERDG